MHSSLTAAVLCILAQAAAAQCTVAGPASPPMQSASIVNKAQGTMPGVVVAPPAPRTGGEFISTAAAGTTYQPAVMAQQPPVRGAGEEEHDRRGGPATLLVALALMCGIALRRTGTP